MNPTACKIISDNQLVQLTSSQLLELNVLDALHRVAAGIA